MADAAMTPEELTVLHMLAAAWNGFLLLPDEHPSDRTEFMASIHAAQDKVLARPARRQLKDESAEARS